MIGALAAIVLAQAAPCNPLDALLAGCTVSRFEGAHNRAALNRHVGGLAASGDCAGARKVALEAGDFDLAQRVNGMCAAPPQSASANSVIRDFAADQSHPFFWIVLPQMTALARDGKAHTLQEAYDQAVATSPEVAAVRGVQAHSVNAPIKP